MGDFFQNGVIATLHDLKSRPLYEVESELTEWSRERPMALLIPSLYSELKRPALQNIVDEIAKIPYLEEVIIGLDRATEDEYEDAKRFFAQLPQRHRVLWNDGPRLRTIDAMLSEQDLSPSEPGKGRNVWYSLGYFLASSRSTSVALHDADIITYDRSMVAKLFYPLVHPTFDYSFCKGYYFRAADGKLNGRVVRLMVTPLVRALRTTIGHHEYLDYIDSFRYPLAGEFSMKRSVVSSIRIPSDWGLEIGVLSEVQRYYANSRICQVDIADAYDHKHQEVSPDDASAGLHRMAIDIGLALFRKLATNGEVFSPETFRALKATYYRTALDIVDSYHADAVLNGMTLDRHVEETTVELFASAIMEAGDRFLSEPLAAPFTPSWSRVVSAVPDILEQIDEAVELDNS